MGGANIQFRLQLKTFRFCQEYSDTPFCDCFNVKYARYRLQDGPKKYTTTNNDQ